MQSPHFTSCYDALTDVDVRGEEIVEMRNQLEKLVTVLLQDNNIMENMVKKCDRSQKIKSDLMVMIVNMKRELVDEHLRRREKEAKADKLGKALEEVSRIAEERKIANERLEGQITYLKNKLNTNEMEKNNIFKKIEKIREKIAEEKKEKICRERRILNGLHYYKRETERCRIVIQYGAKGMNTMKRNLEQYLIRLEEQKKENEKLEEELAKYKTNYSDGNLNFDVVFQELKNLEEFLQPQQIFCGTRRSTLQLNILRKIKELLTDRYCRFIII